MRRFCLIMVLLATPTVWAAELTISIEGLKEDLVSAARSGLALQQYAGREVTPAQIRRLYAQGATEIRAALEPYGYYNTQVEANLEADGEKFRAVYRVTLGEPVIVRERKVTVQGAGAEIGSVRRAVRRFKPEEGEPLDHGLYEASKDAVQQALLGAGFLRAWTPKREVQVARKTNSANINVEWLSGDRYKFGDVMFEGAQFEKEFLDRFIPWKPGDYYSPDQLLALQQRLVDADYFASVLVQPVLERGRPEGVPIQVEMSPAKRSVYTAGVYVSTDTGPGVRFGTERRWLNRRGHKAKIDLDYAQRLQSAGLRYQIPLPGPNDRSFNFGASFRDEDTDTSTSRTGRVAANETRQWLGFTRTLGVQYITGNFEIAEQQRDSNVLFAEATLTKKVARNLAFPRRGYSLALSTRFAPETALTDTSFSQVTLDAKWIRSPGRRQRILLRGSVGAMVVDDFDQLPPELRFFAGGDRSIRGFDYQELGTTNDAGEVIGGTHLAVASAEYEYYFLEDWGVATFVDGGDAFRTGEFDLNVGAGIGARWRSPVGILRLDVGKPVKSDLAEKIRFHISIGPDL